MNTLLLRALAGFAVLSAALAAPAAAKITPTRNARAVARAMAVHPGQVLGAAWVKRPPRGTPSAVSTTERLSFPRFRNRYAILSTGDARGVGRKDTAQDTSHDNGGRLYRGTRDTVTLRVRLRVPSFANCLTVRYRFLSEEDPEYVKSPYNDAFLINLDRNTWRSRKGNPRIRAPRNFAFDWKRRLISVNGTGNFSVQGWRAQDTTFDAATRILRASTPARPGVHRVFFTIFDQGDRQYDSAVMIDGLNPSKRIPCRPGSGLYS